MDNFTLRPAQAADFPAIRRLIRVVRINPTGLDWRRFIVAEAGGQFAGCAQLKPHGDGSLELASLAVEERFRGQGLARCLLEALLSGSPRPLYLTCRAGLGVFYQKFGFRALPPPEMPPYFRRLNVLAGLMMKFPGVEEGLLVMRL
ncbi:GNAT family N-acetyltransferase [bacterium]|nr:GNAT family N-acetyltransferase [bacterium]NCT20073.1 GNAT family N-acetyltransferase [bacterium]OIO85458.1 MAG: hypothetical protein AUK01_06090 [Anaerolineae bacterium CG2_30_57_67]